MSSLFSISGKTLSFYHSGVTRLAHLFLSVRSLSFSRVSSKRARYEGQIPRIEWQLFSLFSRFAFSLFSFLSLYPCFSFSLSSFRVFNHLPPLLLFLKLDNFLFFFGTESVSICDTIIIFSTMYYLSKWHRKEGNLELISRRHSEV